MDYRNWTIRTFSTFLGFSAQYTSPTGQEYNTSDCFPSDEQALSYARARVDWLVEWQRSRHQEVAARTTAERGATVS